MMHCHSERSEAESKNLSMLEDAMNLDRAGVFLRSLAALGMTERRHSERSEAESKNLSMLEESMNLDHAGMFVRFLPALGMTN
jgi:hypothetical protein